MAALSLLGGYQSDDEDAKDAPVAKLPRVESAPAVPLDLKALQSYVDPSHAKLFYNPTAESMWEPVQGPLPRLTTASKALGFAQGKTMNAMTGWVEEANVDNHRFEEQYHTFQSKGYALDPSATSNAQDRIVGNVAAAALSNGATVVESGWKHNAEMDQERKEMKKKRKLENSDPKNLEGGFTGPWTPHFVDKALEPQPLTPDQQKELDRLKEKRQQIEWVDAPQEETSEFFGSELKDYQGRSWIEPPSQLKNDPTHNCYIPKKLLHTWRGHKKGVSGIQFFPEKGHLLLSSSMDTTIKLWDVHGKRQLLRNYQGHGEAVRGIQFKNDGRQFLSYSYDRWIKVWDTETGQVISRHTSKKIPYCMAIHPDRQDEFLVGQSNKRIVQWDTRSGKMTQDYNEHLGPVNTVTFLDRNRRFVSTGDDKKALVWEYGIPVVIHHIAEPDMHSMPYVAIHPSKKFWVGQSQDNQILVYTAINRFKQNKKKRFVGHLCAGYAAQIGFSPDGKFIMSGDAEGRVFFWDWKTSKIMKKLKAHDQVTIGCQWHPIEKSRVATCSWDGTIKYWD